MKILTRNGQALVRNEAIIAQKPYLKLWGYATAIADGTTDIYHHIYNCFATGIESESDFPRISVSLEQFAIEDDGVALFSGGVRDIIYRWCQRVCIDNSYLCYHTSQMQFVTENGYIKSFSIVVPNNTQRAFARKKNDEGISLAKRKVFEVYGISAGDSLTETQKRNVAKCLHDWLMVRTRYKTGTSDYWSQKAYSALTDDAYNDIKPVCGGYADAMAYLLNLYGITAVYVAGHAISEQGHAWVLVSFTLPFGQYSSDADDWSAIDLTWDDKGYDHREGWTRNPWDYFCTNTVYHDNNDDEVTRTNSESMEFPVAVPSATYPYNGDLLYVWDEE